MSFALGMRSRARLEGVDARLARVVEGAIDITTVDFGVFEGLRSRETQELYLARGVTRTLNSKHCTGRAVDLVPWLGGMFRWEWPAIYPIAVAMRRVAIELDVTLRWGGVWDRHLNMLGDSELGLRLAVERYAARHPGPDFLDGPHYELAE